MKAASCILKIAAVVAAVSAVACLVVSYWDKIMDAFYTISDKIQEKKEARCFCDSDCDDFDDVVM